MYRIQNYKKEGTKKKKDIAFSLSIGKRFIKKMTLVFPILPIVRQFKTFETFFRMSFQRTLLWWQRAMEWQCK